MIEENLLHRRIWNGAVTNYLGTGVRLLKTVFLTRILFFQLGEDGYGFWTLLWATFGYILLFELGFGKTIQKYAAESVADGGYDRLNQVVHAVYSSYLGIAALIVTASAVLAWNLPVLVHLPPGNPDYFQWVFFLFGLGCAAVFPSGIVPEILVGLQRMHYRNWVIILNQVLELAGIWLIFKCGGSLLSIAVFVGLNNLGSNLIMLFFLRRLVPGLKLRPGWPRKELLRELVSFSGFIYLMAISKLILTRTDPLVLSSMIGMAAVATYQLGTRLPDVVRLGTGRFQEALGPAAAMYFHSGKLRELQSLWIRSQRFSIYVALGAMALFFPMVEVIMKLWLHVEDPVVTEIAHLMIINAIVFVIFRDTALQFLLMTGYHRVMAWSLLAECVINLGISILLVWKIGVMGVIYGTLLPNIVLALLIMLPLSIRESGVSWGYYFGRLFLPSAFCCAVIWGGLYYCTMRIPLASWSLGKMVAVMGVGAICYLIPGWWICLDSGARQALSGKIKKYLRRKEGVRV